MSYIVGSATVDGTSINPIITTLEDPEAHEQLIFTVDGNQKHTIVYETIITRAYSSDMIVENAVFFSAETKQKSHSHCQAAQEYCKCDPEKSSGE